MRLASRGLARAVMLRHGVREPPPSSDGAKIQTTDMLLLLLLLLPIET